MKRILTLFLAAIVLISTIPSAFADTNISSYMPGSTENQTADEETADILGKFTKNGYINRHFNIKMPSIDSERNEIKDIKNNEEVKQYLKENEFYTIYKADEISVSVYRLDCYGSASSESQFLKLLSANASSCPWQSSKNKEQATLKISDEWVNSYIYDYELIGDDYWIFPALRWGDEESSVAFCFVSGNYVLVISGFTDFEYDIDSRIEHDVENWNDISYVNILSSCAIGTKKDGTVVTAGIIPHCLEEIRDWKNVKKIVGELAVNVDFYGLTNDGKLLVCRTDLGENYEIKEDYDSEVLEYSELDKIIDISYGDYNSPTCLTADGKIFPVRKEAVTMYSCWEEAEFNCNGYLEDGEKLERIYQDPYFSYNCSAISHCVLLSNKGNVYIRTRDIDDNGQLADKYILKKLNVSNVQSVFPYVSPYDYSVKGHIYTATESGEIAAFCMQDNYTEKTKIGDYKDIRNVIIEDTEERPFLILADSLGNVHTTTPAAYNGIEDWPSAEPATYEPAHEMSQWEDVVSIEYNHYYDFSGGRQYYIGIKKDGTAVCSFHQRMKWSGNVSSKWVDDDATVIPYKQLDEPVINCIKISISEENKIDIEKGEASLWVAGKNKNWIKVEQKSPYSSIWFLDNPMDVNYIKVTYDDYKPTYDDYLKSVNIEIDGTFILSDFFDD